MSKESDKQSGLFKGLRGVFGRSRRSVSEEEIRELVDDNEELLEDEKRMIGEILQLDQLTAADIMQPRVDMIAVEESETARAALERMRGTGYSRLPVFHEDLDHVVGVVNFKDLIAPVLDGDTSGPVSDYMHDVLFVPNTKDLFPLLSEMQTNRQQMALVVDEYGGTDGLITVEDIVEEIVGEIVDESDSEAPFLTQLSQNEWLVDGRFPVEEARELGWPVEESDQYDTIAGWLLHAVHVVPKLGEEFQVEGFCFKVRAMRRRRIQTLHVTRGHAASEASLAQEEASEGANA